METKFTPIAMRCNKEQFKTIKPKLKKFIVGGISNFEDMPYLINNRFSEQNNITNYKKEDLDVKTIYETWDEETFLRACGIEVEETFTVSKEFILEAYNSACTTWKRKLEEKFPSVFVKDELEVGRWYKVIDKNGSFNNNEFALICFDNEKNPNYGFGFTREQWTNNFLNLKDVVKRNTDLVVPATPEEVETALINEAKKRGFKDGVSINCLRGIKNVKPTDKACFVFVFNDNYLYYGGAKIFDNGKWATIIEQPTEMTVAEIEQKLGCKIKIVG